MRGLLFHRFELSISTAGVISFWMGVFTALSQLASPIVAARFGLVNTMVFTHIPANVFLALVPFMPTLELAMVFLALRSLLSSMDVPARNSYVMAVVTPGERPAAARGVLKITYDLLLLRNFSSVTPPEEIEPSRAPAESGPRS